MTHQATGVSSCSKKKISVKIDCINACIHYAVDKADYILCNTYKVSIVLLTIYIIHVDIIYNA